MILIARSLVDEGEDRGCHPLVVSGLALAADDVTEFRPGDVFAAKQSCEDFEQRTATDTKGVLCNHNDRRSRYLRMMQLVAEPLFEPHSLAFIGQEHLEEFTSQARVAVLGQLRPQIEVDIGRAVFGESWPRLVWCGPKACHLDPIWQRQPKIERRYLGACVVRDPIRQ